MADASSIRKTAVLPTATARNKGSIRYNTTDNSVVISDGTQWLKAYPNKIGQAIYNELLATDVKTKPFYIAGGPCRITAIKEIHNTAGNDSAAVTLAVTKETGTQAPGAGVATMTAVSLKATAKTVQAATLSTTASDLLLNEGDRLSVLVTGTTTTLAGVSVTVELEYLGTTFDVTFVATKATDLVDTPFYIAYGPTQVVSVKAVHTVAGITGALTLMVEKDTGTSAPGAGALNVLTPALSLIGTIKTVQSGVLSTTTADLLLAKGDRLSAIIANPGSDSTCVGVVCTATLRSLPDKTVVTYSSKGVTGGSTDEYFYTATRPAVVTGISYLHSAVGATGAVMQVTKDTSTDAPGAGSNLVSSTGFTGDSTANTVQFATLTTTLAYLTLNTGDRLSVDYNLVSGTNITASVELQYI
jgi:hypothetical protein